MTVAKQIIVETETKFATTTAKKMGKKPIKTGCFEQNMYFTAISQENA
jgi:hypothetical protein